MDILWANDCSNLEQFAKLGSFGDMDFPEGTGGTPLSNYFVHVAG